MRETWAIRGLVAAGSGAAWWLSVTLHDRLLPMFGHAAGIDILFPPSGVRMIALLVGGVWAAVGVSLGSLFLVGHEFGVANPAEILMIAACTGFAPFAALWAMLRLMRVDPGLGNLLPKHLPLISFGLAAASAVLHNVLFWLLGLEPAEELPANTAAMAMGDFLGCLFTVALLVMIIRLSRHPRR